MCRSALLMGSFFMLAETIVLAAPHIVGHLPGRQHGATPA